MQIFLKYGHLSRILKGIINFTLYIKTKLEFISRPSMLYSLSIFTQNKMLFKSHQQSENELN